MFKNTPQVKLLVSAVAARAVAGGACTFTSANTVPDSTAGSGSGAVSGFAVTNLHYALNASTPSNIDSLSFNVSPAIPSTGTGKALIQASLSTGARCAPATPYHRKNRRTTGAPTKC